MIGIHASVIVPPQAGAQVILRQDSLPIGGPAGVRFLQDGGYALPVTGRVLPVE